MDLKAYIADQIFTGDEWLPGQAVVTRAGNIEEIIPAASVPSSIPSEQFNDAFIAPAFIDLQIYGAYGRLLAVYPTTDSLSKLNQYCNEGGAAFCLPTVATNTYDVFHRSIDAVGEYWAQGGKGILGLHIEGPWINPVKRGAHIESLIHSPTLQQVEALLKYGNGVIKMITLAPEMCKPEVIDLLLSRGIIISAGHSNATYAQATAGFDRGIRTVTHLYNAMSPLQHRAPGLAGATMDNENVMASIIPDGHHVDFAAIRIAKRAMKERLFVITDAVTETSIGPYPHELEGDKYVSNGILSGSALHMNTAVKKLIDHCDIELGEALRMCSLYPARVFGADQSLGRIQKSFSSNMVVLDQSLNVRRLIS